MCFWDTDTTPDPAIVRHLRALAARLVATPAGTPGIAPHSPVSPDPAEDRSASPSPHTEAAK